MGLALSIVLGTLLIAPQSKGNYTVYSDPEGAYSFRYPTYLADNRDEADSSKLSLKSDDPPVVLTAWSEPVRGRSLSGMYRAKIQQLADDEHPAGYRIIRRSFYVVTWNAGNWIVYERVAQGKRRMAMLRLYFPKRMRSRLEPMVTVVSRTFRATD
jgi:hypothetical protein